MKEAEKIVSVSTFSNMVSLENIFTRYNIPQKLRFAINLNKKTAEITYICPDCGAVLQGKWEFENGISTELAYFDAGRVYQLPHKDQFGSVRGYFNHREITDQDFQQLQKIIHQQYTIPQETRAIWQEIMQVRAMEHCPVCNAKLIKQFPFAYDTAYYSLPREMHNSNDWYSAYLKSIPYLYHDGASGLIDRIEADIATETSAESEAYIRQSDVFVPQKCANAQITLDFLKSYLMNLINLETNIISLSKRLEQLYYLKACNRKDVLFEDNLGLFALSQNIAKQETELKNKEFELEQLIAKPIIYQKVTPPPEPTQPSLEKPGLFNKKKVEARNAEAIAEYEMRMVSYAVNVKQCEEQEQKNKADAERQRQLTAHHCREQINQGKVELESARDEIKVKRANLSDTPTKARGEKHVIEAEISSVETALKETFACRNDLYSYNIIFEKYRNLVALSTFYEYLISGRCEALEGMNGAYNLYENEVRLNAIITKLDEIKENQYLIYNKLKSIEDSLSALNQSFEKAVISLDSIDAKATSMNDYLKNISANTAVIAHNSAVTAYYSKINAELTNALGFMVALK